MKRGRWVGRAERASDGGEMWGSRRGEGGYPLWDFAIRGECLLFTFMKRKAFCAR
jgi:hypothetical protein